jgi:tetratricopeptide (TPR) repeat protein
MQGKDQYLSAKRIAHAAAELDRDERHAFIAREADDDEGLAREVWWMISAIESTGTAGMPKFAEPSADLSGSATRATAPRNYQIVRRLGEGGMGVVYLAERSDGGFVQQVALKFLNTAAEESPVLLERFTQERQLLARMEHPGIARLLDGGVLHDGRPFLAMEYIDGERIDAWCVRRQLSLRERVALFLKVCAAVEHAHRHLVIHRDIKPANILVTRDGEPKLLDFGIARVLGESGDVARTETVHQALTLAYASPEQIDKEPLTTSADVYSLGVVFYELVSGRRPFQGLATPHQLSSAIMHGNVRPPSQHATRTGGDQAGQRTTWFRRARNLPADIDAIALKAMRREASKRYASVAEFSDDLERFLTTRAVRAMRGRFAYGFGRYVRRNRWLLAAVSTAFLAILAGLFASLYALNQARVDRNLAELRQHEMERTVAFQQSMLESVDINAMGTALVAAQGKRMLDAINTDTASTKIPAKLASAATGLMKRAIAAVSAPDIARDALDTQVVSHALDNVDKTVGDDPLLAANLRQSLARVLITIGSYDHAIAALKTVVMTREQWLPPGDRRLLSARADLGRSLLLRGKLAEAKQAFDEAGGNASRLPIEDPLRIDVETGNAEVIAGQGRLQEARAAQEALYRNLVTKLPEADRQVMRVRRDLVSTLIALGKRDEAIAHMKPLAPLYRSTFGPESLETLDANSTLAELLNYQNEHEQALALATGNAAIRTQRQGGEHLATLRDLQTAATALQRMDRDDEALPVMERVLAGRRRQLGDDNPQTLDAMNEMVFLLGATNEDKKAVDMARIIFDTRMRVLGPEHQDTLFAGGSLASLLNKVGRHEEALEQAKATLVAMRRVMGNDYPLTFATLDLIARIDISMGRWQDARDAHQEALDRRDKILGPLDAHTLESATRLYAVDTKLGDAQAALDIRHRYLDPLLALDPRTLNSSLRYFRDEALALVRPPRKIKPR